MALGGTPYEPKSSDASNRFTKYIEVLDEDAVTQLLVLNDHDANIKMVEEANFELLRQGGCGAGSFKLAKKFDYDSLDTGMYIRVKYNADADPEYLGIIEEIEHTDPSGVFIRTQGPFSLLNNIQVGGFDSADLARPHLFAASDWFIYDPDHPIQSWDVITDIPAFIQQLYTTYIDPKTPITLGTIGTFSPQVPFGSAIFRGQESLASVIRVMAESQYGASFGVDAQNRFFFRPQLFTELAHYQQGAHLTELKKTKDMDLVYNKLIIYGDLVYRGDGLEHYSWQYNFANAASIDAYGGRKLSVYIPWFRIYDDALAFADRFFDRYSEPTVRWEAKTIPQGEIWKPWLGTIGLIDKDGADLIRSEEVHRIQVNFSHVPVMTFVLGPEDLQLPKAPAPHRWELPQWPGGPREPDLTSETQSLTLSSSTGTSTDTSTGTSGSVDSSSGGPGPGSSGGGPPLVCNCVSVLSNVTVTCDESGNIVVTKSFTSVCGC